MRLTESHLRRIIQEELARAELKQIQQFENLLKKTKNNIIDIVEDSWGFFSQKKFGRQATQFSKSLSDIIGAIQKASRQIEILKKSA